MVSERLISEDEASAIGSVSVKNRMRPGMGHWFVRYNDSDPHRVESYSTSHKTHQEILSGALTAFPVPHKTSGIFMRRHVELTHRQFAEDSCIIFPAYHVASRAWIF